jgi:hypothetical protein
LERKYELANQPWHDDPGELSYKGMYIVTEDLADTMDDFGQGHYLDPDKVYSRPEYAWKGGTKVLPPNYLLLVKIEYSDGRIGWMVMITKQDTSEMFGIENE